MSDLQATSVLAKPYVRYSIAVVAVAAAFLLHFTLEQLFGQGFPPYITFYPAVLTVAIAAGLWPGILATALAAAVVDFAILFPRESFAIARTTDAIALIVFVGMGVFMSLVAEASRRNQKKAAAFKRELALHNEQQKAEGQLQKLNRTLQALSNCNQALIHAANEPELLRQVCNIIRNDCGHAMVWIGYAEEDEDRGVRPVAHAGFEAGYLETLQITWSDSERGRGPTGTAIRTGKRSMCRNMLLDPAFLPWRDEAIQRGYAASLVLPLMDEDKAFGAITIYSREPYAFAEDEVGLLTELAADLSYGITMLRLRAAHAQAEEKLAKAFATNPAAIVITRLADGVILDVNEAFATMFNYRREEAIGSSAVQFWPALENRAQCVQQLLEKGSYTGQEQRMLRRSGTPFVALGSAAILNVAGEQLIISTWLDISVRKKAESRLRRFYETDLFAILYWTIDGGVIDVNDRFLTMTGYTREDLLAGRLNWSQMTPPEYHALDEDARRQIRETGVHLPYEKEFVRKDGTRVWGLFSAAAWEDNRNEGVSFILDITLRKRAEDALRESEERWATTLQSIGDAVISTDSAGRIRFMNDVAQRLTGWPLAEARGMDLSAVFNIVHEETRIKPESPVAKVLRSGRVVGLANHTALIRRDGAEIPIEDSAAPILNRNGQIEGVVLVFHDVLEQRNAEKALRTSDRLATTGRLAATIAHEIHNPLDVIANLLYLIDQDTHEDGTREFATMASRELIRVTQMTRRMLAFQRESAKPIPVEIREILGTVIELYERKLNADDIHFEQRIEIDGQILALPGELRQMFANLVGNAIEAVAPRKGNITLRAYTSRDRKSQRPGVRVVVADNGPGIPSDVYPRIFEPFFTTKGESGTGLGLWIASDILRKYDGVMKLRTSTKPHCSGTCFSIFLPFQSDDDAAVQATPACADAVAR